VTEDDGVGEASWGMCKALGLTDEQCHPTTGGLQPSDGDPPVTYIYFDAVADDIYDPNEPAQKGPGLLQQLIDTYK
jgi:hypothetical protein